MPGEVQSNFKLSTTTTTWLTQTTPNADAHSSGCHHSNMKQKESFHAILQYAFEARAIIVSLNHNTVSANIIDDIKPKYPKRSSFVSNYRYLRNWTSAHVRCKATIDFVTQSSQIVALPNELILEKPTRQKNVVGSRKVDDVVHFKLMS